MSGQDPIGGRACIQRKHELSLRTLISQLGKHPPASLDSWRQTEVCMRTALVFMALAVPVHLHGERGANFACMQSGCMPTTLSL